MGLVGEDDEEGEYEEDEAGVADETDGPMATVNFVNFTRPDLPFAPGAVALTGRHERRQALLGSTSPAAIATAQVGRAYLEVCEELLPAVEGHGLASVLPT